jgi:hypothetical protein
MIEILTEDDLDNDNFCHEAHRGDKHRQEVVFDKGNFAFGSPRGSRTNPKTANDLSRYRWRTPILDSRTERDLIRGAKSGEGAAKQKLVQAFHRLILKIVSQYSGPPHADLMAAGLLGFCEAINRFNENRGCRLSTYAEPWIGKCILLAIEKWRRDGASGETRQDRYIFSNPTATAEQVVAAVGGTLANAEKAIARLAQGHDSYDTTEASFDENGNYTGPKTATSHEICLMYDRFSRFQLAKHLRLHEPACGLSADYWVIRIRISRRVVCGCLFNLITMILRTVRTPRDVSRWINYLYPPSLLPYRPYRGLRVCRLKAS